MLKFVLLLMLFQNLETVLSFQNTCPAIEDLEPCSCRSQVQTIQVSCSNVMSLVDLRRALSSTKDINNVHVKFWKVQIDKIPSDLFKGLDVKQLSISYSDLKSLGDDGRSALEGLEDTLEECTVLSSFSRGNVLEFLNVSGLRAIKRLKLGHNNITNLGNEWFKDGPTSLTNLILQSNGIERVGDEAFANLVNLRNLELTSNRYLELKRSMFPSPATHLYSVNFSFNNIGSLPKDIFSDMPALREVVLQYTAITQLPETTWSPVWRQLAKVNMFGNVLKCDSHIEWMFKTARPQALYGFCEAPSGREKQTLREIIDSNS